MSALALAALLLALLVGCWGLGAAVGWLARWAQRQGRRKPCP